MNKLDEIIAEVYGCKDMKEVLLSFDISPSMIRDCMIKAMEMVLNEAADNAEMLPDYLPAKDYQTYYINKKSITDTLNKYL